MKKLKLQSFFAGILTATLLFAVISTALAVSGSVTFNAVNLTKKGSEKLSIGTPEYVYATYYSGSDIHDWELSQDEINAWVVWLNYLAVSPINLEESKTLIDYMYYNSNNPQYSFDVRVADRLECIAYYGCGLEHTYLRMDNTWYCVDNPTEPFNKLF